MTKKSNKAITKLSKMVEKNCYNFSCHIDRKDVMWIVTSYSVKGYRTLHIPGFDEARTAIEQYVGAKKGYKKNKYKYAEETVRLVEEHWSDAIRQWDYHLD